MVLPVDAPAWIHARTRRRTHDSACGQAVLAYRSFRQSACELGEAVIGALLTRQQRCNVQTWQGANVQQHAAFVQECNIAAPKKSVQQCDIAHCSTCGVRQAMCDVQHT
jgi:hypothetical protein